MFHLQVATIKKSLVSLSPLDVGKPHPLTCFVEKIWMTHGMTGYLHSRVLQNGMVGVIQNTYCNFQDTSEAKHDKNSCCWSNQANLPLPKLQLHLVRSSILGIGH